MDPKIAFLFGAGASQPPGEIEPCPPPLGDRLYGELVREFPNTWGALDDDENEVFGEDGEGFEAGMKRLWEKYDDRAWPALIDMGIYFARFRPPPNQLDCYSRLVIALRARDLIDQTSVTTLNYECLFEIASCRVGVNVNYDGPLGQTALAVAKPHGSCNFVADAPNWHGRLIGGPGVDNLFLAPTKVITNLDEIERDGYNAPPIMSMFESSKRTPINAEFLTPMREHWKRWATAAEVIVVVGARPHFIDAHVWEPIVESNAAVWYIGGKDGDFEPLAKSLGSRLDYLGCRFGECLTELLTRLGALRDRPSGFGSDA